MGLSFDGNGRYVGWSNLFDYSTVDTITASEELPMPKKIKYTKSEDGFNINDFVNQIESSDGAKRIQLYAQLLNTLYKNKVTNVNYTNPYGDEVLRQLGIHEFTNIPVNLKEDASKNFISSHIQNTVQNLRNMIGAYSPIEMEDFRAAANESPKGEQASKMTMLNPTTKLLMQIQNITGKNVIGIAANGEKGSFMWHYYLNDVFRNPTQQSLNYAKFEFRTTRIKNRANKNGNPPETQLITTLPDVNLEGVDINNLGFELHRLTGDITVDLMISQVLSAATDNAKELILAKVNAGNKLAKMYLFLITMGFNINDIVKFMTSPAINFIDAITDTNIFSNQEISMKDAINIARGNYKSLDTGAGYEALKDGGYKDLIQKLDTGDVDNFKNPFNKGDYQYNDVEDLVLLIGSIKHLQNYEINQDILDDLNEFQNVLEGADEFSALGQTLGINQGIPTSKIDLQKRIQRLQNIYAKRFSETRTPLDEQLDVQRFFTDPEYATSIKENYNNVKKCINIFDIIDHIPQFKNIFKIFSAVLDIDHNLPIKTQIYDYAYNRIKSMGNNMSEQYQKNLLRSIDNIFISRFIDDLNIAIPYPSGVNLLRENRQSYKATEGGLLRFDSLSSIASFKYIFENQIIPDLKEGITYDYQNGEVVQMQNDDLKSNPFIQALIKGSDHDIPLYKANINMMTIDSSNDSKIKFQTFLKGLKELKNIKVNGIPVSDLFVLYNLIVNKNQYGSDRLTTLFDSFLQNYDSLSMIKDYLKYIGDLDYSGTVIGDGDSITMSFNNKDTTFLMEDLQRMAAPVVRSIIGQTDPTVIINTPAGPQLYERVAYSYNLTGDLIPNISGETIEQKLERIYNDKAYFVLGGSYKSNVDKIIESLKTLDDINTIKELQKNILTIQKVCE